MSVLIYEGVISGIFDYDYAPQSALIENRRVWVNISQEGQSDIELLREEELINALLVSSKSYKPVVLYQVSDKGQEILKTLARKEKEAVNAFAHKPDSRELLRTTWDGESYWLESSSGYKRRSTTTDTEGKEKIVCVNSHVQICTSTLTLSVYLFTQMCRMFPLHTFLNVCGMAVDLPCPTPIGLMNRARLA